MELYPIHAFGIHGPIRDNIVFYEFDRDKHGLIFPVGNLLASFQPETNQMHFFERKQSQCNDVITALTLSPSNKHVATAIHGSIGDGAQILVFQTASRKKVTTMTHRSKVNSLCFSSDSKWLIVASDDLIAIWSWEKEKLDYSGSITGNISRISCPQQQIDSHDLLFTTTGVGHARVWVASSRHRLNNFQIMQTKVKEQKYIFTDHTWLKSNDNEEMLRLVVIMEPRKKSKGPDNLSLSDSSVVIYQLNENVESTQPTLEVEDTLDFSIENNVKIFSISPYRNDLSFILGGSQGKMYVYEYEQDRVGKAKFKKIQQMIISNETDDNIMYVQLTSKEDVIVVSDSMKVYKSSNTESSLAIMHEDDIAFSSYVEHGHFGGVKKLDCSIEKSLIVSCGQDNSIKICDYEERRCILTHEYQNHDEPNTIAIHPSGHKLLVGYRDKISMYHILVDRLKIFREMSCKTCHDINFAPQGHYFAAVLSNDIHIYATYTISTSTTSFVLLHCFPGHSGLVRSLSWANDHIVFSSGSDKNVYGWDIHRGSRIDNLNVFRSFGECTAIEVSSEGLGFEAVVCTSDGALHRVIWSGIGEIEVTNLHTQSDDVSISLAFNEDRTLLFVGTMNGFVRCFEWNSIGSGSVKCSKELCCHSKLSGTIGGFEATPPIKSLKSAGKYLFSTGGIDGSIFLCTIKDTIRMHRGTNSQQNNFHCQNGDTVVLTTLEDYNQRKDLLSDLEQKIVTLNNEHEYALHSNDALWKNEIKELTDKTNEIVKAEHLRYEEFRKKYDDTIKFHVIDLDKKDKLHDLDTKKVEETYEERLEDEKCKYDRLKNEMSYKQKEFNLASEKQKVACDKKIEGIVREYESIQKKQKAQIAKLEEEAKDSDKIFTEILDQQEEEYEMELRNIVARSDEKLHEESIQNQHMKGAVQNLNSKRNQLTRLNDELRSKHLFAEETYRRELSMRKETQIKLEMEKDLVSNLQSQMKLKDSEIKVLQSDVKCLTNNKVLLETKIQESNEEKIPLNKQIQLLEKQIYELQEALDIQRKEVSNLNFALDKKEMKLKSQLRNVRSSEQVIRQLKSEFISLSGLVDDKNDRKKQKLLREKLDAAYKKFRLSPES